jgi:cytochrome c oxidase subunit 6a
MLSQRFSRGATRLNAQLRSPVIRSTVQRRFNSTVENEFVKERQHAKEHAVGTTGEDFPGDET